MKEDLDKFAERARDAFKQANTIEALSRVEAFVEDGRFMRLPPESRVTIRAARAAAIGRVVGAAGAA